MKFYDTYLLLFYISLLSSITCRNHDINIKSDKRPSILLSHFGYTQYGYLLLNITDMHLQNLNNYTYGLTLDHSTISSIVSYVESNKAKCVLNQLETGKNPFSAIDIKFLGHTKKMSFKRHGVKMNGIVIFWGNDRVQEQQNLLHKMKNDDINKKLSFKINDTGLTSLSKNLEELLSKYFNYTLSVSQKKHILDVFSKSDNIFLTTWQNNSLSNLMHEISGKYENNLVNIQSDLIGVMDIVLKHYSYKKNEDYTKLEHLYNIIYHSNNIDVTWTDVPTTMMLVFPHSSAEGSYDLFFHNCAESEPPSNGKYLHNPVDIRMILIEKNLNSYLSAGDQPLALLYLVFCGIFCLASLVWAIVICTSKHMVFKIHYLMLVLVIMKALTLFFHGINYYELGKYGVEEQGWAIMYYITHLLKGALLFTTIILIGAGWAFIKHFLTKNEKTLFLIVIPLQIFANIVTVILDESETSAPRYLTWRNIFLLIDLICCGAILFPVIWSIRHLTKATNTDGKQLLNLAKLRLFRQFYVLVICYIYATRIIICMLVITVEFKVLWTVDLFRESTALIFMLITGYKFRPFDNNPYLLVPDDEDYDESENQQTIQMEHAWGQSGSRDGVVKLKHTNGGHNNSYRDGDEENGEEDDDEGIVVHFDKNDKSSAPSNKKFNINTNSINGDLNLVHTSRL